MAAASAFALLFTCAVAWTGPCSKARDGSYCWGHGTITCKEQRKTKFAECLNSEVCDTPGGPGSAACVDLLCHERINGSYCWRDEVITCENQKRVNATECPAGSRCRKHGGGFEVAACTDDVCHDEADGLYCKTHWLVRCQSQKTVNSTECAPYEDCDKDGAGFGIPACRDQECREKIDGTYCGGNAVLQCQNQRTVNFTRCDESQYCQRHANGVGTAECISGYGKQSKEGQSLRGAESNSGA
eukprot:TRINITY_DN66083_c0_g1_i1.p1 TRINITY_DN66083_c0_g1~~TRINITY_DN66083_c0_g1_i1.p1  ORF type:complete len:253 (-),score=41.98 TRINITY_DN66083_c0_g1_i1:87-815(-)